MNNAEMYKSSFGDSHAIICVSMERVCILEPRMSEFATVSPFELEDSKGAALSLMNIKPTSSTAVAFFEASGVVRDSVPRHAHDVDDVSGAAAFWLYESHSILALGHTWHMMNVVVVDGSGREGRA